MNPNQDMNRRPGERLINDDLRETVPQARRGFRENLEAQLLMEFQVQPAVNEEENIMIPIAPAQQSRAAGTPVPLTLLTALAAVWVIITIALIGGQPQPSLSQITTATMSPTPSATPYSIPLSSIGNLRPVLIAAYDLPRAMQFDKNGMAKLYTVYWPEALVPEGTYAEAQALADLYLQNPVQQWQPILANNVGNEDPNGRIPTGKVAVTVPLDRIATVRQAIVAGQTIDIYAAMLYVDVDEQFQSATLTPNAAPQMNIQRIAVDAEVVQINTVDETQRVVTLAVSVEDATTLEWALDAQLPLMFVYPANFGGTGMGG